MSSCSSGDGVGVSERESERAREENESEDAGLESEEELLQVPHLGHPAGLHASAVWTSVVSGLLAHLVPLPSPSCRISASLPQGGFSRLEAPGRQERLVLLYTAP